MKFLRRRREISAFDMARAVYWSILYQLAVLDMETLASKLCAELAGSSEAEMIEKCQVWYQSDIATQVAPKALRAIEDHQSRGEPVVLLTAATQFIAEQVGQSVGTDHTLCTQVEVKEGVLTGRLSTLCFGVHKVTEAEDFASQHGISLERSVFYSDSYNDLPMLERVGTAVAVNPDGRLGRVAKRRGWRIERWD